MYKFLLIIFFSTIVTCASFFIAPFFVQETKESVSLFNNENIEIPNKETVAVKDFIKIEKKETDITNEEVEINKTEALLPASKKATKEAVDLTQHRIQPPHTYKELTDYGIVVWTNYERIKNELPPLVPNNLLTSVAVEKATDILARQFFAHNNPDGEGAAKLAIRAGYESIVIGENLALGNYTSSEAVVLAWMNSPTHRENILKLEFTEIGVSAIQGIYEGREVWVLVQIFGRPLSLCQSPSEELVEKINLYRGKINHTNMVLQSMFEQIEEVNKNKGVLHTQIITEYNETVQIVSGLIDDLNSKILIYNQQIADFNLCIKL